jgi:hypothetical protein
MSVEVAARYYTTSADYADTDCVIGTIHLIV